ncbi:MAG: YdeI/OmpD-associated family protein, partial [Actinomycetota bacterium]|nr:YdeI/OmpD-associated family protein [Actinomycetota bacterium]
MWVKFAKKGSGIPSVSFEEALEGALCYGWIDGLRRRFDDDFFLQRFTPRRPSSKWSKINRAKARDLIEAGRMRPPGLAEVERAQADGRWDAAYDSPANVQPTPELLAALDANPKAKELFEQLDRRNRQAILYG